jgi:hypothetical protein
VRRRDRGAVTRTEEYRQAVRYLYDANTVFAACDCGVRRTRNGTFVEICDLVAVNLLKPGRLRRQMKSLPQPAAILSDGMRRIPHMRSQIQRSKRG